MSDVGKFYIDDHQHLLEVLEFGESKVAIKNWTIGYTFGWDKIVWTLCTSGYHVVSPEHLELAKKIYA